MIFSPYSLISSTERGAGRRKRQRDLKKASKVRTEKAKAFEKAAASSSNPQPST